MIQTKNAGVVGAELAQNARVPLTDKKKKKERKRKEKQNYGNG